jgi:hypothetical protein
LTEINKKYTSKIKFLKVQGKIYLLSVGKAATSMTEGLLELCESEIEKGYMVIPYGYNFSHTRLPSSIQDIQCRTKTENSPQKQFYNFLKILKKKILLSCFSLEESQRFYLFQGMELRFRTKHKQGNYYYAVLAFKKQIP